MAADFHVLIIMMKTRNRLFVKHSICRLCLSHMQTHKIDSCTHLRTSANTYITVTDFTRVTWPRSFPKWIKRMIYEKLVFCPIDMNADCAAHTITTFLKMSTSCACIVLTYHNWLCDRREWEWSSLFNVFKNHTKNSEKPVCYRSLFTLSAYLQRIRERWLMRGRVCLWERESSHSSWIWVAGTMRGIAFGIIFSSSIFLTSQSYITDVSCMAVVAQPTQFDSPSTLPRSMSWSRARAHKCGITQRIWYFIRILLLVVLFLFLKIRSEARRTDMYM